ncbi:MAG TPA: hypothetical protein PLD10_13960 [Rhodopila sp.]|nr:hypothetical protein [Rhodopila sp.]
MIRRLALPAVLALGVVAGCTQSNTTSATDANPYPAVPPLISEPIPKPPVTAEALMWQPGHWDWTGSGYVWAKGQYVPAAGHGNMWMPGWWARTPSGWQWQPPHWMS